MPGFKIFCFLFFIFQLLFTVFAEKLIGNENLFPVYNWNIFHTRPDKFWTRGFILIHKIEGTPLNKPTDILDIKNQFKEISYYTFTEKIRKFGESIGTMDERDLKRIIDENLTKNYSSVEWEYTNYSFDVIDYYLERKIISSTSLGHFKSVKSGGHD